MIRRLRDRLVTDVLEPAGIWLDDHSEQIVGFVFHRITRAIAAWILALLTAALLLNQARHSFDKPKRLDGNDGHCTIDFGGQWMMGAMLVQGHGRQLYNRTVQREVLLPAYPRANEEPGAEASDADKLMSYFMGKESPQAADIVASFPLPLATDHPLGAGVLAYVANERWTPEALEHVTTPRIGGPLYPPINALVYAPLGAMPPQRAYRLNQFCNLLWAFVAAMGVRYLSRGQIWVPVAATLIMIYPGYKGSIHLGQNAALTLAILVWGWALIARNRQVAGGLVWGLLAFKPVWAAAFFIVPFFTFRWRTCLAMLGMGAALALATLPFVGIQPWLDWLKVGKDAADLYKTDYNWVFLSRDLLGIPRRWLLDFSLPTAQRDLPSLAIGRWLLFACLMMATAAIVYVLVRRGSLVVRVLGIWVLALAWRALMQSGRYDSLVIPISLPGTIGWGLFAACLSFTVLLVLLRRKQARAGTGTEAGFLLLGAWLCCFHFMYYDVLLTALPLFVLLAEPRQYIEPLCVALVPLAKELPADFADYYRPWPPEQRPALAPFLQPEHRHVWVLNRMVPTLLVLLLLIEHLFPHIGLGGTVTGFWGNVPLKTTMLLDGEGQVLVYQKVRELGSMRVTTAPYDEGAPWDTYTVIGLWLWCGILWLRTPRIPGPAPPPPPERMQPAAILEPEPPSDRIKRAESGG